jgi:arylsulfatase A
LINNQSDNAVSPERETMMPTIMKKAGYVTASVGKWGQICLGPGEWGFDEYLKFPGSGKYWSDQQQGRYTVNGQDKHLADDEYLPDVMHRFLVDFIQRHQEKPFYVHYAMSHIHVPILRTPDSKPGEAAKQQLYTDNIVYMDKLVGQLMAELDRLHLRENTIVLFTGDNGTARFGRDAATINGRPIFGVKGVLNEGGCRVPLIVNWPGTTPGGAVNHDLVDFSDFFPTFAELGAAAVPANLTIDGRSFAAQTKGQKGTPREWVYVELNGHAFVRDARYKLTLEGELLDMRDAPFDEIAIPQGTEDVAATAARQRLQKVLDEDHPANAKGPAKGKKARKRRGAEKTNEPIGDTTSSTRTSAAASAGEQRP